MIDCAQNRRTPIEGNLVKPIFALILLGIPSLATAATITLTSTTYGFANNSGAVTPGNHAIGWYTPSNVELRQYLLFDRSAIAGTITAATLRLESSATSYLSPDPQETWQLFDVTTPLDALTAGTGGAAAFADLGTGISLASRTVNAATNSTVLTLDLNSSGITYLNNQTATFALGGALTSLTRANSINEAMFNSSSDPRLVRELVLTYTPSAESQVPEPATYLLCAAGALSLVLWSKRTR